MPVMSSMQVLMAILFMMGSALFFGFIFFVNPKIRSTIIEAHILLLILAITMPLFIVVASWSDLTFTGARLLALTLGAWR